MTTCSNRTKNQSGIHDSSSQRADVIQRFRKGDDPCRGDATKVRFETHRAAKGRGNAYGASGIRANAAIAEARSNGGSGATTGPSGNARKIPGIADGTVMRIVAGDTVGELVHVGFAEDDNACIFELPN